MLKFLFEQWPLVSYCLHTNVIRNNAWPTF